MKTEISLELRNKIRRDMLIVQNTHYANSGDYCGILSFDKDEEFELFEECIIWGEMIDIYFRTSYNAGKAKRVGRFSGIKPKRINLHSVDFTISGYDNPSWKDWFDVDGEKDDHILVGIREIKNAS
jgi:hypothetical protein